MTQTMLKDYPPIVLNDLVVSDQGIKDFLEDYTKGYVVNNLLLVGNNFAMVDLPVPLFPTSKRLLTTYPFV